ncbi:hypothetical protein LIER_42484 [Lithospermum erythrorhizon]|uniref:Uncharacterized protein n=1 Tax=Lithospermum erythrorhizon TaxID=34254 RepID=A0AAV3RR33_LITER
MTTLQRSSYSFRRQGSSGRVWTNKYKDLNSKYDFSPTCLEQVDDYSPEDIEQDNKDEKHREDEVVYGGSDQLGSSVSMQPILLRSKSERKAESCGCTSIWGSCTKPRTTS